MDFNELYNAAKNGDTAAEKSLFSRLSVSFCAITQRRIWNQEDGEEVAQEALMTVLEKYRSADIETTFAGWAHTVLKNKILDYIKVKEGRSRLMNKYVEERKHQAEPPDDIGLVERIKRCFFEIHQTHRQHARILNLQFHGFSTEEICTSLRITRNNYYVSLSRARAMLEKCLSRRQDKR